MREKARVLDEKIDQYHRMLPNREACTWLSTVLNAISCVYPPAIVWLLAGSIGLFLKPDPGKWVLASVCLISVGVLFYTVLGVNAILQMRLPFDPLIILFGLTGFWEIFVAARQRVSRGLS